MSHNWGFTVGALQYVEETGDNCSDWLKRLASLFLSNRLKAIKHWWPLEEWEHACAQYVFGMCMLGQLTDKWADRKWTDDSIYNW